MTQPRRAASRRANPRSLIEVAVAAVGLTAGVAMMVVGWGSPAVPLPAPLPRSAVTPGPGTTSAPVSATGQPVSTAPDHRDPSTVSPSADAAPGPDQLLIPSLAIAAGVDEVRVANHALEIPDDPSRVGRWSGGASVHDSHGTVLVSGHVAWGGERGALWGLAAAEPGTEIQLTDVQGVTTLWRVTAVRVAERGANLPELFRTTGPLTLAVVTCGGRVVDGHFSHNVIVLATPDGDPAG